MPAGYEADRLYRMISRTISYQNKIKTEAIMADNCDTCVNYIYDEDYECYCCDCNLDEDEMSRFLSGNYKECPYYQLDNEYLVVRHQM